MTEQGAVCPNVHTKVAICRPGEIFSARREGEGRTRPLKTKGIDKMAGGQIPYADDGVLGRRDNPTPVVGEGEVVDVVTTAPKLADSLSCFDIHNADAVIVA